MNYLDAIILIPILWGAFNGFRKGLIIEVASLLALVVGIYGAIEFSVLTSAWLHKKLDWSENAVQILAFILTFAVIVFVIHMIARGIQKLIKLAALGTINRIFGAFFGAGKYLIIVAALLYIVNSVDKRYPFIEKDKKQDSYLFRPVSSIIPFIYPQIEKEINKNAQSLMA